MSVTLDIADHSEGEVYTIHLLKQRYLSNVYQLTPYIPLLRHNFVAAQAISCHRCFAYDVTHILLCTVFLLAPSTITHQMPGLPGYLAVTKMSQKVTAVTFYNFEIRSVHY